MDQLKQYKRVLQVRCVSIAEGSNPEHLFEVKFQQSCPHSLFKYSVAKSREELLRLFERLEGEIFGFENPFSQGFLASLTRPAARPLQLLNATLTQCTARLDVLLHHHFLDFFAIHLHYPDFAACLKEELLALDHCAPKPSKPAPKERKEGFDLEKGWVKPPEKVKAEEPALCQPGKQGKQGKEGKEGKQAASFQSLINLVEQVEEDRIETGGRAILDFAFIKYFESKFLVVLEEEKKGKLSGFITTFFHDSKPSGSLSIHRREGAHYLRKFQTSLEAEPVSMEHNAKTSMIMTLTSVGVYVHLLKLQQQAESLEIFAFIPLVGIAGIANNCLLGEVYLARRAAPFKLYLFTLKDENLRDTEYKFKNAASVCFEQANNRLFVSDGAGIHIFLASGGVDIKRLHFLPTEEGFVSLRASEGYLYCVSGGGRLTVAELRPPQKEQLMSVTTTLAIPAGTRKIVGSRSRRVIVSCFRDCVVLIDTLEGPLNSFRLKGHSEIRALCYDPEGQRLIAMGAEGGLASLSINRKFQ